MKHFIQYWIGALKLTKSQAVAAFYRFVRYVAGSDDEDQGDDVV